MHGELSKLDVLLPLIREDAVRRKVEHRIIFLGDLIDRGHVDTGACFGGPLTAVVLAPGEAPRFLRAA